MYWFVTEASRTNRCKMRSGNHYIDTIDTIFPDGYARESLFRDAGDMLDPPIGARIPRGIGRWRALFDRWSMKRRGRLALRELDDHQLDDIGLTRAEAAREIRKSLWL